MATQAQMGAPMGTTMDPAIQMLLANQALELETVRKIPHGTSWGVIIVLLVIIIMLGAMSYYMYYENSVISAAIAAVAAGPGGMGGTAASGSSMGVGQVLTSGTTSNKLIGADGSVLQIMTTGELVLTSNNNQVVLSTPKPIGSTGPYTVSLNSTSGDLEIYDTNKAKKWNAGVMSSALPTRLSILAGDGSLVITDANANGVLWCTAPTAWVQGVNQTSDYTDKTKNYAQYVSASSHINTLGGGVPMVMPDSATLQDTSNSYFASINTGGAFALQDAFNNIIWSNNVKRGTGPYTLEIRPFHLQIYDSSTRTLLWDQPYGDSSKESLPGTLQYQYATDSNTNQKYPTIFGLFDSKGQTQWWAPSSNIPQHVSNATAVGSSGSGGINAALLSQGPPSQYASASY